MSITTLVIIGMVEIFIIAMCYIHAKIEIAESSDRVAIIGELLTALFNDSERDIDDIVEVLKRIGND